MSHRDGDVKSEVPSPIILVTPATPLDAQPNHGNEWVTPTNQREFNRTSPTKLKGSKSSNLSLAIPSLTDAPPVNLITSKPGSQSSTPTASSMTSLFRLTTRRLQHSRRLVFKDGTCNVTARHVTDRRWRYLADLFTTVIDLRWRWHFVMFATAFAVSWIGFALVWWTIAAINGDLKRGSGRSDSDDEEREDVRCVANVDDFHTALLFSIETQHTIGYGLRYAEVNCLTAIATMMLQAGVGVFIQCFITGIVFSKLSRPKSRAQTVLFSRHAVVCRRDGHYCLLFRVGDLQRSHIVGISLRAVVVRNRLTREGESIPLCQYPIDVEKETSPPSTMTNAEDVGGDSYLFLVWPVTVVHRIDERSPFWDMTAEQVRTSYLADEIRWGHRLTPLDIAYHKQNGQCDIDCAKFHSTTPIDDMPNCSARAFAAASKLSSDEEQDPSTSVRSQSNQPPPPDCGERTNYQRLESPRTSSHSLRERSLATGKVFNVLPVKGDHPSNGDSYVDSKNCIVMHI